jgi:hypothetical protein
MMRNMWSKSPEPSADAIEAWYAARAAEHAASNGRVAAPREKNEVTEFAHDDEGNPLNEGDTKDATEHDQASGAVKDNYAHEGPSEPNTPPAQRSTSELPRVDALSRDTGMDKPFTVARRAVSNKVQLWAGEARDATKDAIEKCKKLGLIGVAKEVGK